MIMGREPRGGGLLFAEFRFARFHADLVERGR